MPKTPRELRKTPLSPRSVKAILAEMTSFEFDGRSNFIKALEAESLEPNSALYSSTCSLLAQALTTLQEQNEPNLKNLSEDEKTALEFSDSVILILQRKIKKSAKALAILDAHPQATFDYRPAGLLNSSLLLAKQQCNQLRKLCKELCSSLGIVQDPGGPGLV